MIPSDGSVIRCDRVGSFPWSVLHDRHPVLVRQVAEGRPYPPEVRSGLERLAAGLHDEDWFDRPFLEAEELFYTRLLAAVGYDAEGPWRGVDPFGPVKAAELTGDAAAAELAALDEVADDLGALLLASLWGNRADLSFLLTRRGPGTADLLVDDRPAAIARLEGGGPVAVVADNAGRELLADLALVDHLLRTGRAGSVTLHVKPRPCFVSDAMLPDVLAGLDRLAAAPTEQAPRVAGRLRAALRSGQFAVRTDPFWFSTRPYAELPAGLGGELAASRLVILKGDLNYRRLVDDRHWPPTDPFALRAGHLGTDVLALRTGKSEVVVGLGEPELERLGPGDDWRTDGTHGLIQYAGGQPTEKS